MTPELATFWRVLNRAALGLVGEEYPEFAGDPRAAARAGAVGQRGLEAGGPVRRALGRKYLAGLTPGYRRAVGLRGNVHGWPREEVNAWRLSLHREFDAAYETTSLPARPDYAWANDYLVRARRSMVSPLRPA